jgi:hypothetical protein
VTESWRCVSAVGGPEAAIGLVCCVDTHLVTNDGEELAVLVVRLGGHGVACSGSALPGAERACPSGVSGGSEYAEDRQRRRRLDLDLRMMSRSTSQLELGPQPRELAAHPRVLKVLCQSEATPL